MATPGASRPREGCPRAAIQGGPDVYEGKGHGAALMRSGLAKSDAAGLPAYLETFKPANVPLYEHFGFTVREELRLPAGGPELWTMWREPRHPANTR